jgi:hypothetical protein
MEKRKNTAINSIRMKMPAIFSSKNLPGVFIVPYRQNSFISMYRYINREKLTAKVRAPSFEQIFSFRSGWWLTQKNFLKIGTNHTFIQLMTCFTLCMFYF